MIGIPRQKNQLVHRVWTIALAVLALSLASACVSFPDAPAWRTTPTTKKDVLRSFDGTELALREWVADEPKAVFIALHGMNDYSFFVDAAASWWAEYGQIHTYAYDQRGFGANANIPTKVGHWAGSDTMALDLRAAVEAVRAVHPDTPLYVLGHSMGGAVVLRAMADDPLPVDGAILVAPAVWGSSQMPLIFRLALNLSAGLAPGKSLTGERAGRAPSDNREALRALFEDPLVIKETRLDATLGVVRLMGEAWRATDDVGGNVLVLIGEKDEIIPPKSIMASAERLCGTVTVRQYQDGWHMLLRDRQAETVWRGVLDWVRADQNNDRGQNQDLVGNKKTPQAETGEIGPAALSCPELGQQARSITANARTNFGK
ncbi:MAG: lysophospholipase [Pseudomonadota bacterium]